MRFFLLLLPILIFAQVSVKVNKTHLTRGEELVITITVEGKDIKFPDISKIGKYNVIGSSVVSNIEVINGKMKESLSKSFIIIPDNNLTIPSFTVIVDGKVYKTKPIKITVSAPKQTIGDNRLDINISKTNLYIGESAVLDVKLKFKPPVESIQIQKPDIEGFIVKDFYSNSTQNEVEYKFLITPLKTGSFKIGPLVAKIGYLVKENPFNDSFFNLSVASLKYKTIYSNQLQVNVKPIPNGAVYGEFNISMDAKKVVNANEPNKAVLKIEGCGDFYNLPEFKLNIPNATIYSSKPQINLNVKNNKLCGSYIKTFTIIAENDYTIPPITLKEFNSTLKTISTKPINVKVIGAKTTPIIKQNTPKKTKIIIKHEKIPNYIQYLIYTALLIAGIIIGILLTKIKLTNEPDIIKKIKKANQKELFNLLIPYSDNSKIKEILRKLEDNIYKGANHKISKKEIIKIIKEL
jgi:hypothetical protein